MDHSASTPLHLDFPPISPQILACFPPIFFPCLCSLYLSVPLSSFFHLYLFIFDFFPSSLFLFPIFLFPLFLFPLFLFPLLSSLGSPILSGNDIDRKGRLSCQNHQKKQGHSLPMASTRDFNNQGRTRLWLLPSIRENCPIRTNLFWGSIDVIQEPLPIKPMSHLRTTRHFTKTIPWIKKTEKWG